MSKKENKELKVSETFYSIQGEGVSMGTPSIFLRLQGCNLTCGGPTTIQSKKIENGATWRCDTIEVWKKGEALTVDAILAQWENNNYLNHLSQGAHLVITGGEPLLQTTELEIFLEQLQKKLPKKGYFEIETNGTITPTKTIDKLISHYTVSPKLANSGMSLTSRIQKNTLEWFSKKQNAYFKFVISDISDITEIQSQLIQPFKISSQQVYLMPACDTKDTLLKQLPKIADLCKRNHYKLSSRLQLSIWDQTVGV
ncbi:7-carboxy-7-deazaguanine synthase QueE [Candidatus Marinamargulisbacteria bacterium SCGC AG-439-L15]|nr:7-carboxy-7-deazaguanine synthase QueE [Candidatus Marinamargulisbacteria bacterium SCGC AG-439-L15]